MLRLSSFDYTLPKDLIAQYPLVERDRARLMVVDRKRERIEHCLFKDIIRYFRAGDILVLNDTKVLPARLLGRRKSGGKVEALLLNRKNDFAFEAMLKPSRLKRGEKIRFNGSGINGIITGRNEIVFEAISLEQIYKAGVMPLPPYIKREEEDLDKDYYQTVYARCEGAVAAPTAGLHFTERLIGQIKAQGVETAYLTLHVGPGTFKPVREEDITKHKLASEYFCLPEETQRLVQEARRKKNRIIATGTTTLRALETYAARNNQGNTDLFVYPGFKFRLVDALITNFHLPRTTLFILVCAFAGTEVVKRAYQEAIDLKYRFYSYGDAMLIL